MSIVDQISIEESDYATVTKGTEDILPYEQMVCTTGEVMCSFHGGVGPAWFFDRVNGYLHIRVVNVHCYLVKRSSLSLLSLSLPIDQAT